ncbi:hypothetical protein JTB14_011960 [Gonioctena quinquepunctata]|nr:hypothetical protein JTB14_011960 [Gonioctena quinquepunctata]
MYTNPHLKEAPQALEKACVIIKNDDQAWYAWSIVSAVFPQKNSDRICSYPHYPTVLNLKGIQFLMTVKQVPRFEKQNNLSVNVYILKKEQRSFQTPPMHLT